MKTTENTVKNNTSKPSVKKISKFGQARGILKGKIFMTEDCWDLGPIKE